MRSTRFSFVLPAAAIFVLIWIVVVGGAQEVRAAAPGAEPGRGTMWVYVGTSTQSSNEGKRGIYRMRMDMETGALTAPELAYAAPDAFFLALSPEVERGSQTGRPASRFLYAINNIDETVEALALSPKMGALTLLNRQPAGGKLPSHLTLDASGRNVLVAAYMGGTVAVFPLMIGGRLGAATCVMHRQAIRGVVEGKEAAIDPHPHCIDLDPSNRFALGCDFGQDRVFVYRFDAAKGTLTPNDPPSAPVAQGCGPRHLAFDTTGRFVYVVGESNSMVSVFAWDGEHGKLKLVQTISTLPADFKGQSWPAEVLVHPSGKFLYATNRGHESIAIFAIDSESRRLKALGYQPAGGKRPQHITIDASGRFMLLANQDSDQVVEFEIDAESGALKATGAAVKIAQPACIVLVPAVGRGAD